MNPPNATLKPAAPPLKSQGIKTRLAAWIGDVAGRPSGRWIEPFAGTCAVALNVQPDRALLCDTNPHLIGFYAAIQTGRVSPDSVREHLTAEGQTLREVGEAHYYAIRERFNSAARPDPHDYLFLNRACFNGMVRFNLSGGFNVPFCRKPARFAPAYVTRIVNQVARTATLLAGVDWLFRCQAFSETIAEAGSDDLIYCDPPYAGRHTDYFNRWSDEDDEALSALLSRHRARFILSTWHHNIHRHNPALETVWSGYRILTREHFYHVGASEQNRHAMTEALVTNIPA